MHYLIKPIESSMSCC